MTTTADGKIRITRRFNASIERVFDAWLDPEKAGKWLFATPTGKMVRVEIDPRVGGSFNITRRESEDIEHVGTYLEIDRAASSSLSASLNLRRSSPASASTSNRCRQGAN